MLAACNAIGCAFPDRREAAVWGALGVFVGLVALLAVVTVSAGRMGTVSGLDRSGAPMTGLASAEPDQLLP